MWFKSQEQIIVDTIIHNYVANYLAVRMAWIIVS